MATEFINVETADGICAITHTRPPANFLSIASMKEFISTIEAAEADAAVKVITIHGGGGKFFSAGVDVSDHTEELAQEMVDTFDKLLHCLMYGSKPKIAVVRGMALGGGCELIAFCDMVYATENATFGQPEINVGVFPAPAASIFPRLVGIKKSLELILTGDIISAREAKEIGLVNHVCAPEAIDDAVGKLTHNLCAKSAVVLQLTRKAILAAKDLDLASALSVTADIYANELMQTEDAAIGISAFLKQEKPVWKNK
ncbi:crotonase [Desulfosarcina ovata subsp. sediminis]|uniref:Crotonase n=1 Tax=Desulfosarcina ovata subsp. sediminis TaxID=885957 RepID=A0A5K7ZN28_9BACT|nr:enoyl-CoA hydratase-related protein [Desulfosarcina ovata]BBO80979.1 crotonase [Desulfosarcina ovata subsp. sediminis]